MAIPDYQAFMLPVLQTAGDGRDHTLRDAIETMAQQFGITEAERKELLPSGRQTTLLNRVGWAVTYLKKAMLLEAPKRGIFRITERGRQVLKDAPPAINVAYLNRFEEFRAFRTLRHEKDKPVKPPTNGDSDPTPEEALEAAYQALRDELADELLTQLNSNSSSQFEQTVIDLLVAMGYGGSLEDAGKAIGRSGDEGIDGIIKEDRLGLDVIYVQAKRWDNTVGRPEIQKFAGALQGQRARKGVFITTSEFSAEAHDYVSRIETKIVLIDGRRLTHFMIDHNIGVTPTGVYEVKRLDSDYFDDG